MEGQEERRHTDRDLDVPEAGTHTYTNTRTHTHTHTVRKWRALTRSQTCQKRPSMKMTIMACRREEEAERGEESV